MPEPGDKHDPTLPPSTRYTRPWSWPSWKAWMQQCWDRIQWRKKKEINRVLRLRAAQPNNANEDWPSCSSCFEDSGVIYGVYHFTSGRWYVGQTVSTIHKRAQEHWHSRNRLEDAFHQALARDDSPFQLQPPSS